ncbi:MAG: extracellular solute-binding protein [Betaproteobacteria bacterium]|nr:extracellular solute-binding protein [Betaproteobacteria bacterium]
MKRRDLIKAGAALATAGALPAVPGVAQAQAWTNQPEKGAKLRVMRWKRFVEGDERVWMENTKRFSERYGVEVRVDSESFDDIRPKAAVAANVGSGPDIILGWFDDAHLYPDKLVPVTDVAEYLGKKYGGWYPVSRDYGMRGKEWIALPIGANGGAMVYRKSHVQAAGFEAFPATWTEYLKLAQAMKAKGTPVGHALGHASGDAPTWLYCLWWGFGGKLVDEKGNVTINSPETLAALEYARQLYATFPPGTLSWLDPSNNKAFLDGQISCTNNAISIYYVAKSSNDEKLRAMAADIEHAHWPVGPIGKPTELHQITQAMVFKYSRYPKAAKEYLRFMMEKEQYAPWQTASLGYVMQPLAAYENSAIWTEEPKAAAFRYGMKNMRHHGYAGRLGAASAATLADFIVVDMFAEAASGDKSPKEAAERATKRAERYYKV